MSYSGLWRFNGTVFAAFFLKFLHHVHLAFNEELQVSNRSPHLFEFHLDLSDPVHRAGTGFHSAAFIFVRCPRGIGNNRHREHGHIRKDRRGCSVASCHVPSRSAFIPRIGPTRAALSAVMPVITTRRTWRTTSTIRSK